jgi:predicted signal transduction protein with EAL and GGDEF domain
MLALPFEIDGHQITIGTSIGIAFGPADGTDADELMKNADLALYRAKLEGRGMYRLFHSAMDAEMQARRLLELDLRHALQRGEFELFYQPLIDLHTETAGGFEALLRWRHPDRGIVPPDKFIPHTCLAAASWPDDLRVSVNLSPTQFKVRDLVGTVRAALQDSGLAPDRLELEITETVMLQDTAATLAALRPHE